MKVIVVLERSNRRSSRSRSRDRKSSRRHRDRSREKDTKRRRSRSPHDNNRRKHSRSRSPKDRSKKENKTEKQQPLKKYKYWDVPPVGFEHITPVQYKAMQGKLSSCISCLINMICSSSSIWTDFSNLYGKRLECQYGSGYTCTWQSCRPSITSIVRGKHPVRCI